MAKPTHLDLFSGIGGFSLAAGWAGFETIGFSEIDSYASKVLKKHWPNVPNYGDVRNVPAIRCDLITGGFPCQPFSLAGKRRGAADNRYLWPAMLDVIARCRPTWVVGENVPGIIGMELDRVLTDLEGIGFRCAPPLVIPACGVDAKHKRDRVWIVAHSECPEWRSNHDARGCLSEGQYGKRQETSWIRKRGEVLANGISTGLEIRQEQSARQECETTQRNGHTLPDTRCWNGERPWPGQCGQSESSRWKPEPGMGRVADGIPNRVDRLKCLGNAIVPQIAFQILKLIAEQLTNQYEPKHEANP